MPDMPENQHSADAGEQCGVYVVYVLHESVEDLFLE
jgi:hypothetical protein